MTRSRGFVLVNALVLVAAMAGAAALLLTRSEGTRARAEAGRDAAQLALYLDAFDALALGLLRRDLEGAGASHDHLGEAWAAALPDVELDRGRVAGQISDLQGRFNLNWLANPEDVAAAEAFDRLLARLGISPQRGQDIRAFLAPGGPENRRPYGAGPAASDPVGGALLMVGQLHQIPGLTAAEFARLAPHVAALPGTARININTVTPEVLAAFLPEARPALVAQVVRTRQRDPFLASDAIGARLVAELGDRAIEGVDLDRFGIDSDWFGIQARARLGTRQAWREGVIQRHGLPAGPTPSWHLDRWE